MIESIERITNKTWAEWLQFMDKIDAKNLDHHAIAAKVFAHLDGKIDKVGWWSQGITVEYEKFIGRRVQGQSSDGKFQTSVSKSTKLGMQELMDAWSMFAAKDKEVLAIVGAEVRVSGTKNRITWRTKAKDGSGIIITSEPKKNGQASLIATLMGLESLDHNAQAKEQWAGIIKRFLEQGQ